MNRKELENKMSADIQKILEVNKFLLERIAELEKAIQQLIKAGGKK
ncbi:hypothetical protein M0R04_11610 [Candidatus Dojkabacteria bacterium]|jgi:hypothetical protein|nr:hypothetical protein [Candidatus Dojkabacteria bacterium]